MCRAVSCSVCGKTTWAGCGAHVDQVMASVPMSERCKGHQRQAPVPKEPSETNGLGRLLGKLFS